MTPDEARALGAQALFGEKYGDEVRVVSMGRAPTGKGADKATYSIELCGGTHVARTGDIGTFVLLGDSASSAGVRRIEALTGDAARRYLAEQAGRVAEIAAVLKAQPGDLVERVKALMDERRALQAEVGDLRRKLAMSGGPADVEKAKDVNGIPFVHQVLRGVPGKDLPVLVDEHKARIGSGAILLIAEDGGKAAVAAGVTADLTGKVSAVDLVKAAVEALGGKGGGGRPDMAQGGAKDAANATAAVAAAERVLGG
jgi:alanyl-tRNA synthetase